MPQLSLQLHTIGFYITSGLLASMDDLGPRASRFIAELLLALDLLCAGVPAARALAAPAAPCEQLHGACATEGPQKQGWLDAWR